MFSNLFSESSANFNWSEAQWKEAANLYSAHIERSYINNVYNHIFSLDLERHFIELPLFEVQNPSSLSFSLIELIQSSIEKNIYILGSPGSGKTTLLHYICLRCIKNDIEMIPVYIDVKIWANLIPHTSITDYIESEFSICNFPNTSLFLHTLLRSNQVLLLFDGLDEATENVVLARQVLAGLSEFTIKFPSPRVIFTSRRNTRPYIFSTFAYFEIKSLSPKHIHRFIDNKYSDIFQFKQALLAFLESLNSEIISTPLLLTLICSIFQQSGARPLSLAQIYKETTTTLLYSWNLETTFKVSQFGDSLQPSILCEIVAFIAFKYFESNSILTRQEFIENVTEFIGKHHPSLSTIANNLSFYLITECGLFSSSNSGQIFFTHASLHSYFLAYFFNSNISSRYMHTFKNVFSISHGLLVLEFLIELADNKLTVEQTINNGYYQFTASLKPLESILSLNSEKPFASVDDVHMRYSYVKNVVYHLLRQIDFAVRSRKLHIKIRNLDESIHKTTNRIRQNYREARDFEDEADARDVYTSAGFLFSSDITRSLLQAYKQLSRVVPIIEELRRNSKSIYSRTLDTDVKNQNIDKNLYSLRSGTTNAIKEIKKISLNLSGVPNEILFATNKKSLWSRRIREFSKDVSKNYQSLIEAIEIVKQIRKWVNQLSHDTLRWQILQRNIYLLERIQIYENLNYVNLPVQEKTITYIDEDIIDQLTIFIQANYYLASYHNNIVTTKSNLLFCFDTESKSHLDPSFGNNIHTDSTISESNPQGESLLAIATDEELLRCARAVCLVSVPKVVDENISHVITGTGWLITPEIALTCWHVVEARTYWETLASESDLQLQIKNLLFRFDYILPTRSVDYKLASLEHYHTQLDYALFRLSEREDFPLTHRGFLTLDLDLPLTIQSQLLILQHPQGQIQQRAAGYYSKLSDPHGRILYTTPTYQGSSGAPVLNTANWRVVALHTGENKKENLREGILLKTILLDLFQNKPKLYQEILSYQNDKK